MEHEVTLNMPVKILINPDYGSHKYFSRRQLDVVTYSNSDVEFV